MWPLPPSWHLFCINRGIRGDFLSKGNIGIRVKNFNGTDMKLFDSAFGIHEQALDLRGQRMEIIARNIANSDTPKFKARDLDFKAVLNETQFNHSLKTTQSMHIKSNSSMGQGDMVYTIPYNTSADGNTVELSVEQAKYGKAAAEYQATLRFLEGDMSAVRKALRGD
jgi:flagellar basal-body rod protein FlgB|tara:strand:+ start:157 stop:657 length:501 start_codon:yes stop_codon:yes gene_type:complete